MLFEAQKANEDNEQEINNIKESKRALNIRIKGIELGEGPAIPEDPTIPIYIRVLTHELKVNPS